MLSKGLRFPLTQKKSCVTQTDGEGTGWDHGLVASLPTEDGALAAPSQPLVPHPLQTRRGSSS